MKWAGAFVLLDGTNITFKAVLLEAKTKHEARGIVLAVSEKLFPGGHYRREVDVTPHVLTDPNQARLIQIT